TGRRATGCRTSATCSRRRHRASRCTFRPCGPASSLPCRRSTWPSTTGSLSNCSSTKARREAGLRAFWSRIRLAGLGASALVEVVEAHPDFGLDLPGVAERVGDGVAYVRVPDLRVAGGGDPVEALLGERLDLLLGDLRLGGAEDQVGDELAD